MHAWGKFKARNRQHGIGLMAVVIILGMRAPSALSQSGKLVFINPLLSAPSLEQVSWKKVNGWGEWGLECVVWSVAHRGQASVSHSWHLDPFGIKKEKNNSSFTQRLTHKGI